MGAVVGALHRMPDLMSGQLTSHRVAFPPAVQPAVADVVMVVDTADVVARMAAAVPPGMVDGVDARVGPERVAVGCLGVLPGHIDEPGQPPDLGPGHVRVKVHRAVLVAVVEPEQLAMVEPVLLPGGRRVRRQRRSSRADRTVSQPKPVMMLTRWNNPPRLTSRGDWPKPAPASAALAAMVTAVPVL